MVGSKVGAVGLIYEIDKSNNIKIQVLHCRRGCGGTTIK